MTGRVSLNCLLGLLLMCWSQLLHARTTNSEPLLDRETMNQTRSWDEYLSNPEINEGMFEGDIILSEEQSRALMERKVISSERNWWPRDANGVVNINYRFGDSTVDQTKIRQALGKWEEYTCVRFHKISAADGKAHLKFVTASGCYSYVGNIGRTSGQEVSLAPGCFRNIGTVIHELGHALGLWHEQSRTGRDAHVHIMLENCRVGLEHNFRQHSSSNFGVPYDYSSLMHYGGYYFTKNGKDTIAAKDALANTLIGQRSALSFMDKKAVNLQYKCIDKWLKECSLTKDPCENQGYLGPKCSCVCPAGTSGSKCETLESPYTDALVAAASSYSKRITTDGGTVTSPGYPTMPSNPGRYAQSITAPACHKVVLKFSDFHVPLGYVYKGVCYSTRLLIRIGDSPSTWKEYCGTQITSGTTFESKGRTLALLYRTSNSGSGYRGYNASVTFVRLATPECTAAATATPTPSTNSPTLSTISSAPSTNSPAPLTNSSVPSTNSPASSTNSSTPSTISSAPPTNSSTPSTISSAPPTNSSTPSTNTSAPSTTSTTNVTATTPPSPTCHPVPVTTTPKPEGKVTIINSGDISLKLTRLSTCQLELTKLSSSRYMVRSPGYPARYPARTRCYARLTTTEPRYLKATLATNNMAGWDRLYYLYPYKSGWTLSGRSRKSTVTFLSTFSYIYFRAGGYRRGTNFAITLDLINTKCHQIIKVKEGGRGVLEISKGYPANTICEWLIMGPPGKKIQLSFSRFSIGSGYGYCYGDYIAISRNGDNGYRRYSKHYCGTRSPGSVTSTGSKLNVLVNGQRGGYQGMYATYSLV